MTIKEFITKYGISMTVKKVNHNPYIIGKDWNKDWKANHYEVTFQRKNPDRGAQPFEFYTFYSMGLGNEDKPQINEVLSTLLGDTDALDTPFDEWASNLGYDSDSRKALDIYLICQKLGYALRSFLDPSAYAELKECERE